MRSFAEKTEMVPHRVSLKNELYDRVHHNIDDQVSQVSSTTSQQLLWSKSINVKQNTAIAW